MSSSLLEPPCEGVWAVQGLETASAISLLAVYGNGTRHLMSTPFTATNESGALVQSAD